MKELLRRFLTAGLAFGVIAGGALVPRVLLERQAAEPWRASIEPNVLLRTLATDATAAPLCAAGIASIVNAPYVFEESRSVEWRCFGRSAFTTQQIVTLCDGTKFRSAPNLDDARCPATPSCAFNYSTGQPVYQWFLNGNSNNCGSSGVPVDFCCVPEPPANPTVQCERACDPPPPCCNKGDCSDCFLGGTISIPHGEVSEEWPVFSLGEAGFPSQFSVLWRGKATARSWNVGPPLGPRALHSLSLFLWKNDSREQAFVTSEEGYVMPFEWDNDWDGLSSPSPWKAKSGRHATLTEALCPNNAIYREADGTEIVFHEYCGGSNPLEGTPISLTRPNGDSMTFSYSTSGLLTSVTNRRGASVQFAYLGADFPDPTLATWGVLEKVTAPDGAEYSFVYSDGKLAEAHGPNGLLWSVEVSPETFGLLAVRDGEGNLDSAWTYANNDGLTPSSERGPGETVGNNQVGISLTGNGEVSLSFIPAGSTTGVTNTYTYTSDANALPHVVGRTVSGACPNCGTSDTTRSFWTGKNDLRSVRDSQGTLTAFQDWAADPTGAQHALAYDPSGRPLVVYEGCLGTLAAPNCAGARRREFVYKPNSNAVMSASRPSVIPASEVVTEREFEGTSTRVTLTRSSGHTALGLDGALSSSPVFRSTVTTYGGGAGGLDVTLVVGPFADSGNGTPPSDAPRTEFEYYAPTDPDALEGFVIPENTWRLRSVRRFVDASGRSLLTRYGSYDGAGRPGAIEKPDGTVTELTYDFRGNVTRTIVDSGGLHLVTDSVYNANGALLELRLPRSTSNGRTGIAYTYDDADRLVLVSQGYFPPSGALVALQSVAYFYDAWGNRTRTDYRDSSGATITSEGSSYDSLNRLAEIARPFGDPAQKTSFEYDTEGNMTGVADAQGDSVFYGSVEDPARYDRFGKLSLVQQQVCDHEVANPNAPCIPHTAEVRYEYDPALHLKAVHIDDTIRGGTITTEYVTDDFSQVVKVVSPDSGTTTYRYDGAGRLVESRDARGKVFRFEYDRLGRMTRKINASPITVTVTQPAHGTSVVNADGTTTYTPDPGYVGPDSYTYVIEGRNGDVSTGTVSVDVAAPPVPMVAGGSQSGSWSRTRGDSGFEVVGGSRACLGCNSRGHSRVEDGAGSNAAWPTAILGALESRLESTSEIARGSELDIESELFFTLPELVFDGVGERVCTEGLNLEMRGALEALARGADVSGSARLTVSIGAETFEGELFVDQRSVTGSGLLTWVTSADTTLVRTPGFCVDTETPIPLTVRIVSGLEGKLSRNGVRPGNARFGVEVSLPSSGHVFELPVGATVDSLDGTVIANQWLEQRGTR